MSNKTIRAILIDDDEFMHYQLREKLSEICPEVEVVACAENAAQGLMIIKSRKPDLVFLDIKMPEASGFDLLNQFEHPDFSVVFVTSFNEYAIQALRYSALDYLLKPVQGAELRAAVDRFRSRQDAGYLRLQIDNLMYNLSKKLSDFRVIIPSRNGDTSIDIGSILWCQGDSNYTHFHLKDGHKITASKTLKEYEELLGDKDFMRVHKSYIVNLAHVEGITRTGKLQLTGPLEIEVAKRRLKVVRDHLRHSNSG